MTEAMTIHESNESALTAQDIKSNVQLIQQVMASVMKRDVHYGTIPGTPKPTLYKAGAEKILSTFRIAVDPEVEDLSTEDEARFRVTARGIHIPSGHMVGAGIGECSSSEGKYKWRAAVCDAEYEATPENRRREKWLKSGKSIRQVRTEPADMANTVLKMAKKRAQIDMCLTATGASDVFAQDLEDMPDASEPRAQFDMPKATDQKKRTERKPEPESEPASTAFDDPDDSSEGNVVIGEVQKISEKHGENKKGPWTRYGIKVNGAWYNTFSDTHAETARQAEADARQVQIAYRVNDRGYNDIEEIEMLAEG